MNIDMPSVSGPWRPAQPVDLSNATPAAAAPWAERLDAARAALDAAEVDLSNAPDGADEADRAELVARYRATFAL